MNNTQHIAAVEAAIRAKAPIVAIPIEGRAPFCVRRAKLAGWAKGMRIEKANVVQGPDRYYFEEIELKRGWTNDDRRWAMPEGPLDVRAVTVQAPRFLRISGSPIKSPYIRSSCTLVVLDRRTAVSELGKWSAREREKLEKKLLLGALSKQDKQALKLAKFEDDGEGMIEVNVTKNAPDYCDTCDKEATYECRGTQYRARGDGRHEIRTELEKKEVKMGTPIQFPELPRLKFAIVKFGSLEENEDISFTVTEITSGRQAGSGKTAEEAIVNARQNARKATAERREALQNELAAIAAD